MKFDASKDFKTNNGLTVRIIGYIGNLGPDMAYPYYGYIRFGDGEPAFFCWDHKGEVLGRYSPFNLTEAIDPNYQKPDLYDEFQNVWDGLKAEASANFTESELLDLFMIKEKNPKDLGHNELKSAIAALQKSEREDAIALREKLQERLDFMNAETIRLLGKIDYV